MISQAIQAMNVDQNGKKNPKLSKNEMFVFGLCSISDDWLSDLSNESWPKSEKDPLSHQKWNVHFWIMFNFWWLAKWSEWWTLAKMWKNAPTSSTNEVVVGLAGVILLVISRSCVYCIRLMLVMFISSVDVVLMILLTILISFLVFLFIFSFGSFFLFFLGCDLVSSHSSRCSSFSCS